MTNFIYNACSFSFFYPLLISVAAASLALICMIVATVNSTKAQKAEDKGTSYGYTTGLTVGFAINAFIWFILSTLSDETLCWNGAVYFLLLIASLVSVFVIASVMVKLSK